MSVFLPDVNTLVALAWPNHIHHREAREWFASLGASPWATCPFTQAGFIRVSSNPRILRHSATPREAIQELRALTQLGNGCDSRIGQFRQFLLDQRTA